MFRYIARRLLELVPTTFGILVLTFVLFHVVGGSPALAVLGKNATKESIAAFNARYGYDKPLLVNTAKGASPFDSQFCRFVGNLAKGDFGISTQYDEPVADILARGVGPSLSLTVPILVGGTVVALSLALLCAAFRGGVLDRAVLVGSTVFMSVNYVVWVLAGQFFLAFKARLFPKDFGFDETGLYHFMDHGGRCASSRRFPYRAVADANPANWWQQHEANVLPFLPNLSTGWDDRPWNDHCEIYGKHADDFRRICRAAKDFADRTGVKRLCLAPLNEWGEGSYAEPNAEHGFGFYEAVRETFCNRPAAGWPLNYGPKDVGLGPYDLPPPEPPARATAWSFTDGTAHGWQGMIFPVQ